MDMEQVKDFITQQGWTPQLKTRRNGIPYLYAARREGRKVAWRYISPATRVEKLTEAFILNRLEEANK